MVRILSRKRRGCELEVWDLVRGSVILGVGSGSYGRLMRGLEGAGRGRRRGCSLRGRGGRENGEMSRVKLREEDLWAYESKGSTRVQ